MGTGTVGLFVCHSVWLGVVLITGLCSWGYYFSLKRSFILFIMVSLCTARWHIVNITSAYCVLSSHSSLDHLPFLDRCQTQRNGSFLVIYGSSQSSLRTACQNVVVLPLHLNWSFGQSLQTTTSSTNKHVIYLYVFEHCGYINDEWNQINLIHELWVSGAGRFSNTPIIALVFHQCCPIQAYKAIISFGLMQ